MSKGKVPNKALKFFVELFLVWYWGDLKSLVPSYDSELEIGVIRKSYVREPGLVVMSSLMTVDIPGVGPVTLICNNTSPNSQKTRT